MAEHEKGCGCGHSHSDDGIDEKIATDVASRGLDVQNLTHIFNYAIPKYAEDYTNRIGRTARAGKTGKAISLLSRDDHKSFSKVIGLFDYEIKKMQVSSFKRIPFRRNVRRYDRRPRTNGWRGAGRRRNNSSGFRHRSRF